MRIWKWTLPIADEQKLYIPKGAKILSVQTQNNLGCLWALCDETAEKEYRTLCVYGMGYAVSDNPGNYLGTFQLYGGNLVFHVFEKLTTGS